MAGLQVLESEISILKKELEEKNAKLSQAENDVIKLTKRCADFMTRELKSEGDSDSWSLGSSGSLSDADSPEIKSLKEKLIRLKHSEELLKGQIEVLQASLTFMVHPEDVKSNEDKLRTKLSDLESEVQRLSTANSALESKLIKFDDLESNMKKVTDSDDMKTKLIEELYEKLAKSEEQNSALAETLQETEVSEKSLRDSLDRFTSSGRLTGDVAYDTADGIRPDDGKMEMKNTQLLSRLNSMEEKDTRLRNRLEQLEHSERSLESEVEKLNEELSVLKEINSSQEQTIRDLQGDLAQKQSSQKKDDTVNELQKKYSNMKLLFSQKMDELKIARDINNSQEETIKQLQLDMSTSEVNTLKKRASELSDELAVTKSINKSQEETIQQLQEQIHESEESSLAASYESQLASNSDELVMEYQEEIKGLKEEVEMLNDKLCDTKSDFEQNMATVNKKLRVAEQEVEKQSCRAKIAQNVIDELKSQNSKLVADTKKEYEAQLKDLNTKLQGERVQNSVHRDVIDSMSPQIDKLKCENEGLESQVKFLKEKLSGAECDYAKRKSENEELKSHVQQLERKLDESRENATHTQLHVDEIAKLTQELESKEAESDNLAVDLMELNDKIAGLEKDLTDTQTAKQQLDDECNNYKENLSQERDLSRKLNADLDRSSAEILKLQAQLSEQNSQIATSQTETKRLVSCNEELSSVNLKLVSDYQELAAQIKLKDDEVKKISCTLSDSEKENAKKITKMEETADLLNKELNSARGQLVQTKADPCRSCKEKDEAIENMKLDMDDLVQQLQNYGNEIEALKDQLSGKSADLERLKSKSEEDKILMAQLQDQIKKDRDQIGKLEIKLTEQEHITEVTMEQQKEVTAELEERLKHELESQSKKESQLHATVESLKCDITRLSSELLSAQNQLEERSDEIDSLTDEIKHLNDQLLANRQTIEDEMDTQLSMQAAEYLNELETLKEDNKCMNEENTSLQKRIDKLVLELDGVLSEKQVYIDEITAKADQLKKIENELNEKNARLHSLSSGQYELKRSLEDELERNKKLLATSEERLDLEITALTAENKSLKNQNDSLESYITHLTQENNSLQKEVKNHAAIETNNNLQIENLNSKKADLQAANGELKEKLADLKRLQDELTSQLASTKAELVSTMKRLEAVHEQLNEANDSIAEEKNKAIYIANKQSEKHRIEKDGLQETIDDLISERDNLKVKLSALKRTTEDRSEVTELSQQNQKLQLEIKSLEDEQLEQLVTASAETSILKAQIETMNDSMQALNDDLKLMNGLKSLSTELQNRLKDEKTAHSQTLSELNSIKQEQLTFKEQLEDIKEKYEHSQQHCEELMMDLQQNEDQISSLNKELSEQRNLCEEWGEKSRQEAEMHDITKSQLESKIAELDEKSAQLTQVEALLVEEKQNLGLNSSTGLDNIGQTSTEINDEYIEALKDESKLLLEQNAMLQNENDSLSNQLRDLQQEMDQLETDSQSINHPQQQFTELEMENSELRNTICALDTRFNESNNSLNDAKSANCALQDEILALQEKCSTLTSDQIKCTELENKVRSLEGDLQSKDQLIAQLQDRVPLQPDQDAKDMQPSLEKILEEKDIQIAELKELIETHETYNVATRLAMDDKVTTLSLELKAERSKCEEKQTVLKDLQNQLEEKSLELDELKRNKETLQEKYEPLSKQLDELDMECRSLREKSQASDGAKERLRDELTRSTTEVNNLKAQLQSVLKTDEEIAENYEVQSFQEELSSLRTEIREQHKVIGELEQAKSDLEQLLSNEQSATEEAEAEVKKLQMSIEMLMSSHQTEMSSLQKALQNAKSEMSKLETNLSDHSEHKDVMKKTLSSVNAELKDIKASKELVTQMVNNLVSLSSTTSKEIQSHMMTLLEQFITSTRGVLTEENAHQDGDEVLDVSDTQEMWRSHPTSSPANQLTKDETNLGVSFSKLEQLSKEDLIMQLSKQTKYELLLKKKLDDCQRSLTFYRSAIDNIVDCLGSAVPGVRKWVDELFNPDDQAFSQRLEEIISNESTLQRRIHALEISEKASRESFETKEKEYQAAIENLEDMVAMLKSSKAKLMEEIKSKSTHNSVETEHQLSEIKERVFELEKTVTTLRIQNDELQFAYEQECDRRQYQEEERFKVEQQSKMSAVESMKEEELLHKISVQEQKITNLMRSNRELELKVEAAKDDSQEAELRSQVEVLSRSERALMRKIEILQQSGQTLHDAQLDNTLDQPEDLLRQRIWEMEKMEIHLKQQVSDLEHDREELHEIARIDKNVIHELNIQIAEACLTNKNLKTQLSRFEDSEELLHSKLYRAETRITELEEKLQDALDQEKATRFHLEDAEYSEDNLKFRTSNLERTIESLQATEVLLKKKIDDFSNEQTQMLAQIESLKTSLNESEAEQSLSRRQVVESENREISLKGRISELAAIEASLQTRIRQLELENERLAAKVLQMEKSASDVRNNLPGTFIGKDELNSQIQLLRDSDKHYRTKVATLEKEKFHLEKQLQDVNFQYIRLQSQLKKDEIDGERATLKFKDALDREHVAKSEVRRLQNVIAAYDSKRTSGVMERENFQLNAENKNLNEKLKFKDGQLKELIEKVEKLTGSDPNTSGGTYRIKKLHEEVLQLKQKVIETEREKAIFNSAVDKLTTWATSHGCEKEILNLKEELDYLKTSHAQKLMRQEASGNLRHQMAAGSKMEADPKVNNSQQSLQVKCLQELMTKVQRKDDAVVSDAESRHLSPNECVDNNAESDVTMEELEIASVNSIWEKLEPPVRRSPVPAQVAVLIKINNVPEDAVERPASSVYAESNYSASEVPEESSLWEKLELYEPKKPDTHTSKEHVFEEGPIAPKYCPRRAPSAAFRELSELLVSTTSKDEPGNSEKEEDEDLKMSNDAALTVATKDIARLKSLVTDLERKLASRDTEIKMLRNQLKEVEKETNLAGDLLTLRAKLKAAHEQLEAADMKISSLRQEIIARDQSLMNKQKEISDLSINLRKHQDANLRQPSDRKQQSPLPSYREKSSQIPSPFAVERVPDGLYKSMLASAESRIADLQRQLLEKEATITRLSQNDIEHAQADPDIKSKLNSTRLKYLDDKYTDAATKYYNMKIERDELQRKYDELRAEHSKCPSANGISDHVSNCQRCEALKLEIKRSKKELKAYKNKLAEQVLNMPESHKFSTQNAKNVEDISSGSDLEICDDVNLTDLHKQTSKNVSLLEHGKSDTKLSEKQSQQTGVDSNSSAQTTRTDTGSLSRHPVIEPKSDVALGLTQSLPSIGTLGHSEIVDKIKELSPRFSSSRNLSTAPTSNMNFVSQRKPRAPTELSVEIVGNQKIYIEWSYVNFLDHSAKSNGTVVTGFRIFLNGRSCADVTSPYTTVMSIETSPSQLSELHTVSVQALGANNTNSSLTHMSISLSSRPSIASNRLKMSDDFTAGKRRLFIAYYDYDPALQGPFSRGYKRSCDDELKLKTGDLVIVYGDPLPNGYYRAEAHGRMGLAPEDFIRQIPAENARLYGFYDNNASLDI